VKLEIAEGDNTNKYLLCF